MNKDSLLKKAVEKHKNEGLVPLMNASKRHLYNSVKNKKYILENQIRNLKYELKYESATPTYDEYIYIRGDDLKYQLIPKTIPYNQGSFIKGGDWDQNHIETDREIIPTYENWPEWKKIRDRQSPGLVPYHKLSHVKGFKELFKMDKNRDVVDFTKRLYDDPGTNDKKYRPRQKIDERLAYDKKIYLSIKESGFIPAKERPQASSHDDIGIAITRNGEIAKVLTDAGHRAAFCHILELEKVPVRVQLRHKKWQEIRTEVANADTVDSLSDQAVKHISHPDVKGLL